MQLLQFTIPSSGILQLLDPGLPNANFHFQQITIQNNNVSGNMRVGDSRVSSTEGIVVTPGGGSFTATAPLTQRSLKDFWIWGSSGALVDVLLVQ